MDQGQLGNLVRFGREREMVLLRACVEDAVAGQGRVVLIGGEPGIGKTRLFEETRACALAAGARVLWGRCHEVKGAPPYWPLIQAIRDYVRDCDQDLPASQLGRGGGIVAELFGEIRELFPDLPRPDALADLPGARFRLFDALSAFIRNACGTRPIVLVLDDLHWADEAALVDLQGLSETEVGRLLEATAGVEPESRTAHALHSLTEGNPFFAEEVIRMLVAERSVEGAFAGDGRD